MAEIPFVIELCTAVHQRYQSFQPSFLSLLKKQFEVKKEKNPSKPGAALIPSKFRTDVRYLAELILAGVVSDKEGLSLMVSFITSILNLENSAASNEVISFLISFVTFSGEDFAGIVPKQTKRFKEKFPQMEFPRSNVCSICLICHNL